MFLGGASIFFLEGSHVDLTWARFLVVPLLPAVLREDILNIWKQSPMQVKTFSNVQSIASEKHLKMSNQSATQIVLLDCRIKRSFQSSTEQRCQSLNSTLLLLPSFQNRFVSLQEQPTAGCVQETTREHNRRHYTLHNATDILLLDQVYLDPIHKYIKLILYPPYICSFSQAFHFPFLR